MITISQLSNGVLGIRCNYYYRNRISKIPSAQFDYHSKMWIVQPFALGMLEEEFNTEEDGLEIVYKTPRWVILNEPCPDMSSMYKIHDTSIKTPQLKLKPFDYQDFGIRFSIDKILKYNFCLLADDVGLGKAQPVDTIIPTPNGNIRLGDLKIGDKVFDRLGRPTEILNIFPQGIIDNYKVTFSDGRSTYCNDEHLWTYITSKGNLKTKTLKEMIKTGLYSINNRNDRKYKYRIPVNKAVQYPSKNLDIHPYVMGYIIGNGCTKERELTISSQDEFCIKKISNLINAKSYKKHPNNYSCVFELNDNEKYISLNNRKISIFQTDYLLKKYPEVNNKYSYEKRIPKDYLYGDYIQRLNLLNGLLDSDGSVGHKNRISYSTTSKGLLKDILFLCNSLGLKATYVQDKRINKYRSKECFQISIQCDINTKKKLFTLPRKLNRIKNIYSYDKNKNSTVSIVNVEYVGKSEMKCIYVDNNEHLYLTNDFIVTHNTIQSIGTFKWFIENKGFKKILIICKKSAKEQWCKEITKFTDLDKDFYIDYMEDKRTKKQRIKKYDKFMNADKGILITNHHAFLNDTPIIKQMGLDFIIIDEVHEIKCRTGRLNNNIASVCNKIPTMFLTGTPIMSTPEDIFGIIQISNPKYFGKWTEFENRYIVRTMGNFGMQNVGAKHLDELRDKIQDIIIRRTEFEVNIELPEVRIIRIDSPMDDIQEKLMENIIDSENQILNKINELKSRLPSNPNLQTQIDILEGNSKGYIAARQAVANDPRLFALSSSKIFNKLYNEVVPSSYTSSNKSDAIIDLIQDILSNNDKVILFSKFITTINLISNDIKKKLKVNVLTFTGKEDGKKRTEAKELFENSFDYNILMGTEAMSASLNLQCAKYVINIDQPDKAVTKVQRIGRVRRVGSAFKNVIIYDMITEDGVNYKSKDIERLENIRRNEEMSSALIDIDESQREALLNAMGIENGS